jgi:hypothetical protein
MSIRTAGTVPPVSKRLINAVVKAKRCSAGRTSSMSINVVMVPSHTGVGKWSAKAVRKKLCAGARSGRLELAPVGERSLRPSTYFPTPVDELATV